MRDLPTQPVIRGVVVTGAPDDRYRNFDALRALAATAVIFSHSFLIAEGSEAGEPVKAVTGEIAGIYGVYVFFILSGFLVSRSLLHSASVGRFLWKRFLRVYPGYLFSLVVIYAVGTFAFGTQPWPDLIQAEEFRHRIPSAVLMKIDSLSIPGVVFYRDPAGLGAELNGVYWSIRAEVALYSVLAVLALVGLLRPWVLIALAILGLYAHLTGRYLAEIVGNIDMLAIWGVTYGASGFFAGAFLYFVFRRHPPRKDIALVLAAATVLAVSVDFGTLLPRGAGSSALFPVLVAYPVLWLGHAGARDLGDWTRFGDLSYGLYLFGWPVQQVLRSVLGEGWSGWAFFPLAMAATLPLAFVSWWIVERPALAFKDALSRRRGG